MTVETAGSPKTSNASVRSELGEQRLAAARWFLLPMMIALTVVAGWPLLRSIWFSFTDASLDTLHSAEWIGLGNYLRWRVLDSGVIRWRGTLADPAWWNAVWNTVRFAFWSVLWETVLGMIVALVLNADFRGRGIVRAAILIPWAIPTIVSARMWSWMLNDQFGILNDLGMRLGLLDRGIAWTASPDTAMLAVLVVDVWKTTPFMALLILAGLQMIPKDIYEAADIDGVHPVKQFFKITLPLVRPALMVAIIFRVLDALRIFDLIYVLTPNTPTTKTISVLSQENLFQFNNFAEGSAQSTLLFLLIALFTIVYMWLGRVNFGGGDR